MIDDKPVNYDPYEYLEHLEALYFCYCLLKYGAPVLLRILVKKENENE